MQMNKKYKRKINWKRFIGCLIILFCIIYTITSLGYKCIIAISKMVTVDAKDVEFIQEDNVIQTNINLNDSNNKSLNNEIEIANEVIVEEKELVKPDNMPNEYFEYAKEIANKENAPLDLMIAILLTENETFDSDIIYGPNDDGSYDIGLCQVNSKYIDSFAKQYDIENFDPNNVYQSLEFLAKHINYLKEIGINEYNVSKDEIYMFVAGSYNRGLSNEIKYQNMYHYKEKVQNYLNNLEYA